LSRISLTSLMKGPVFLLTYFVKILWPLLIHIFTVTLTNICVFIFFLFLHLVAATLFLSLLLSLLKRFYHIFNFKEVSELAIFLIAVSNP
jgi:hypothetical protein